MKAGNSDAYANTTNWKDRMDRFVMSKYGPCAYYKVVVRKFADAPSLTTSVGDKTMKKRIILIVVLASFVGILTSWATEMLEPIIRSARGMAPPIEDSSSKVASAVMTPILVVIYPFFCAFYVLPSVRFLLGKIKLSGWRVLIAAFLPATCVWLFFTVLLHSPTLDKIQETAFVIGAIVWLPVFFSSLVASCLLAPKINCSTLNNTKTINEIISN